jgi:hypothetical protein
MKVSKLTDHVAWQSLYMMCGSHIGGGTYRQVFRSRFNAEEVIKVEMGSGDFANIHEWEVWQQVQYHAPMAKWFAPCKFISPAGSVMIQAKTLPCSKKDLPKMVPGFLTDLKADNWGWIGDRVVCHDYGNILIGVDKKLKKAKW